MDLDRFLNLLGAVFGAMGSLYVLKAVVALSPDLIEQLSRSHWEFSVAQIDALTAQKADSIVGIVLVVIALFISIVNVAIVPVGLRLVEWPTAVALVAGLAATAYLALAFVGGAIQRHQKLTVGQIITTQRVQEILDKKRLPASEIESLRVHARTLLGMDIEDSEDPRVFFERLAARIGLQVPKDFDFSEVESPTVR